MESQASSALAGIVETIHYLYPATVFIFFCVATIVGIITLEAVTAAAKKQEYRRGILLMLMLSMLGSYVLEALTIGIYDAVHRVWSGNQDYNIYVLSSAIVWATPVMILSETQFPVWHPYVGSWIVATVFETFLIILSNILRPPKTWKDIISVVLQFSRICVLGMLICFYLELRMRKNGQVGKDPERQPLLKKKSRPKTNTATESGSGSATKSSDSSQPEPPSNNQEAGNDSEATKAAEASAEDDTTSVAPEDEDKWSKKRREGQKKIDLRLAADGNWFTYVKGFMIFWPWFFPVNNRRLQARFLAIVLVLLFTNFMNVMIPMQFGKMGSAIAGARGSTQGPWSAVALYIFLWVLGSPAVLVNLREWLWLPIFQYGYHASNTHAYNHAMSLSADFHDSSSQGDLSQILRTGSSVTDLIETGCFEVVPKLIDLFVALLYLYFLFGPYMTLTAFGMIVLFSYTMVIMIGRRRHLRRDYIFKLRKEHSLEVQGIDGWHTASYFNRMAYEAERYEHAVNKTNMTFFLFAIAAYAQGISNRAIMTLGMTIALYIAVYQVVVSKTKTVADFITLVSYWSQFTEPLQFFAGLYKTVGNNLIDAEKLLELCLRKPTVVDSPNAKPFEFVTGSVSFSHVNFAYDVRKPVIKDVSFQVPGGSTVALVGETGSGKSTILKLIFRFWDISKDGRIEIDGQDISKVRLTSLREVIGNVPQDPILFNDTIMNNIKYARLEATDEEVYEVCRGAAIHDKILALPDGYMSTVGDRGIKLSGGEKQRVAIARALLKNSHIILLDEATSAVDVETESHIQATIATLCKGRTTFIVAHRLSTVMRADRILVIHDGSIIEEGTHQELIRKEGKYYRLWLKHTFFETPEDHEQPENSETKPAEGLESAESVPQPAISSSGAAEDAAQTNEEDQSAEVKSQPEMQAGTSTESAKKAGKRVERTVALSDEESQSGKPQSGTAISKLSGSEIKDVENKAPAPNPKPKRTRPARRQQSKSEPVVPQGTAAQAQESIRRTMDGVVETELTGTGSGDGSLPLSEAPNRSERRVSAPSDPPSGTLRDFRGSARGGRTKRPRHWRLKKRGALSSSSTGSGSTDMTGSSTGVVAPVNTPAEIPTLQAPRIRFAPGS